MDRTAAAGRWGVVTGVDVSAPAVKVLLQPEGVQTDWLPILSHMVGNGWGMVHVPATGTPVFCIPDAADPNNYVVAGATWSTARTPPTSAQGEIVLVHSSGARVALTNDGQLSMQDQSGASLTFSNDGKVTLHADLHVTGAIVAGYGGADQITLQNHTHPVVNVSSSLVATAATPGT